MYTKTRIETMNSASMISDLFEVVNGFVKQRETQSAGCQKKECCHDFQILNLCNTIIHFYSRRLKSTARC
ncbi:hypothetical protein SAMN05216327_107166 [Dyadobacter sp. SG02]|nr:hypothetical protein SAMN05216327_107166 [Dyadobacter sp. SG02]